LCNGLLLPLINNNRQIAQRGKVPLVVADHHDRAAPIGAGVFTTDSGLRDRCSRSMR
jgi:hypothetical protein